MIESMPSADSIIVIWFKLLTFAGKQNNDGVFMMSNRIAYTDEMLASIFRRDVNTIRLALKAFEQFGMIEIIDNVITIPNWGKHQSLDAYEKKKKRDRERVARKRAEQKALIGMSPDTSPDMSPDVAFSDRDKEGEEDKERDRDGDIDRDIEGDGETPTLPPKKEKAKKEKPVRHKYGLYNNVLLSDEDMEKLKTEFPADWKDRIDRLSEYMKSTGKKYTDHLATIRSWARRDAKEKQAKAGRYYDNDPNEKPGATFNFDFE